MAKVAAAPAAHSRSHQQLQQLYGLLDQLFGSTWRQHRVEERAQAPSTASSRNSTGPAEGESPEQAAARAPEACCTEHSDAPLADLVQQAQALHMIFVAGAGQYEGEWLASKLRVAVPGGVLLVLPHSVFAGCGCNRASCAECRATRHCFYSGPLIERLIGVGVVQRQSDGKVLTADEAVAEIQQHLPLHLPQAALARASTRRHPSSARRGRRRPAPLPMSRARASTRRHTSSARRGWRRPARKAARQTHTTRR